MAITEKTIVIPNVPGRLTIDVYFSLLAAITSLRSSCPRRNVGAVLVANNKVISTGYNGAPSGLPHCIDEGCLMHEGHCIRTTHAEINALVQARQTGDTLYCTDKPCLMCFKSILNHGVKRIVYLRRYNDPARELFLDAHSLYKMIDNLYYLATQEEYDMCLNILKAGEK